jgi:hypothetical protein
MTRKRLYQVKNNDLTRGPVTEGMTNVRLSDREPDVRPRIGPAKPCGGF